MMCVNIKLLDILGCFHYILNAPRMSNKQSLSFEKCIHFIFHCSRYSLHLFKPSTVLGPGIFSTYKIYVVYDRYISPEINTR